MSWIFTPFLKCFKLRSKKLMNFFRFKKTNKNVILNKQNIKRKRSHTIFHYYGRRSILKVYNSRFMLKMWKKIRQYRQCPSDKYNRCFYLQNEMNKRQKSDGKHKLSFSKFKYKSANVKLIFTINFILQSELEDNFDEALLIKLDLIGNVFSCYEHTLRKNLRVGYKIVFDIRNCNSYDLLFSKIFLLYSYNEIKKKLLENLRSKFLKKFAITNPNVSNIKSDFSRGISFSERKYICDKDSNTLKFRDLYSNKQVKCSNYLPNFMCHVINRILRDKRRKKIHKKIAYKLRKNVRNRNLLERISILLGKIALANSKSPQLGGKTKGFSISNKQKRILKQLILLLLGKRSNEGCISLIKKLLKKYSLNYSQSLHLKKKYTKKGILKTVNEVKLEMHKALINEAVMALMTITNHPEIEEEKNCPIFKQLLTCFKQIILKKLNKCKPIKCNLGENILYKNIHGNVREYFYRKLRQIINNKFQRNLNKIIRSRMQKFIMKNLLNSQKKKKNSLNKHCFKEKKKNETNLPKQSKKLLKLDKNETNHSIAYALFKKTKLLLSSWDKSLFKSKIPSSGMSNISYPTPGGYRTLKTNKLFFEIFICTCCKLALKTAMLQLAIEKPMSTTYVTDEINKKNLSPGCKNYLKAVFDRNNFTTDKILKMKLKAVEELDLMRSKLVVQKVNESMSSEIENYEGSILKSKMSIKKIKMIINLLLNRFYQKILIYGMKSYFIGKQDTLKNLFYEKLNSQQSLHKTDSKIQRKLIKRNERPKLIKAYNIQNNIIITDSMVNYFQKINYYQKKKNLFKDNKTKGFLYENDKMKYFEKVIYEITKNDEHQITPFAAKINLNIKNKFDMNVEKVIIPTNIDLIKGQITECLQNIVILEKKKWNEILNKQIKNNYKLKFIFQTILKEKQNQQLILTKSLSKLMANKLKYFYQKSRRRNITTCKGKINRTGKKPIAKEKEICNIWNYMVETYCEEAAMNEIYKIKYISKYLNLGLPKMDNDLKNLIQLAPVTGVVNLIMYKISFCIGVEIKELLKGTLQDEKNLIRLNKLISISQTSNLILTTKISSFDGEYSFSDTYFDVKFNKVGVIMFRLKTDFIPDRFSVKKEICYLTFYIKQKNSLVRIMGSFLLKVLLSAMNSSEINQWGYLRGDVSFCTSFKKVAYINFFFFCRFLNCISEDIGSDISITLIDTSDLSNFNPIMETEFITNQKLVNKFLMLLEKTVKFWLQQLSYVTCLANQVKFITHYEPPNTELEIDRFITSTSWNLKKFYKCRPCRIYINYLKQKKSDLYTEWLKLKLHFIEMVNRSTVCIEYLISLDKFWSPFHHGAFNKNSTYLPGILHCLIKFHLISQKNNKPHAVSNIIFKLSNRLIYNCINFLTDNFVNTVWEVSFYSILDRIKVCNSVLLQYCCLMRRMDHKQKYFLQSSLYKEKFRSFMKKLLLIIYLRRQQFKCERFLSVNAMMFVELKRNLEILLNFMSSSVTEIIDPSFYLIKQIKMYNDLYNNIKEKLRRNVLDIVFATKNPYTLMKHIKRYSNIDIRCIHLPLIYKTADHLLCTQIVLFMRKCSSDWKITKNFYSNNKIVKHLRYWKSYNNKMDRYAKIFMKFLPGFDGCACTDLREIYLKAKKVLFIFERLYYRILAASLFKVKLFMHSTILNGGSNIRTGLYMLNGYLNVLPLVKLIRRFSNCHFRTSHTHNYWALIADDILRFWIRLILILKKFFLLRCVSLETRNLLQPFLLNFVPYFLAFTTITWTDRRKYALLNNIEKFMLAVETFLLGVENYRKEALERAIEITEKVLFIFISTESMDYRNLLKQTSSDQKSILHFQSLLSLNAEHKVIELVNMIISKIKYNTINKEKIYGWYHQIKIKIEKMYSTGYHVTAKDYFRSKILFVNTKNYLKHCEVFFNYNYQRYMEGNYRAFFLAILLLRDRIEGYHYGSKRLPPLWKISFHMDGDNVIFLPSLSEILQSFKALFLLLLELSTKISLWGNFYITKSSPNKQNLYIEHKPSINLFLLQREVNPASEKRRMLQKFLQEKEDDRLKPKIEERPGGTGVLRIGIPTSVCLQQSLFSRCIRKKADNHPKLPLHLSLLDLSYKVLSENDKFQQNSKRKKFVRNIHKKNLIRIKKNCDSKLHRHRICKFLTKLWIKKILIWYRFVLHFFRKLIKMKKKVNIHILKLINDTVLPLKYNRYIQILQIGNGTKINVGKYNCKLLNNKFTQINQRRKLRKILESIFLSWTINNQKSPSLTLDKLNTLESLKECIRLTPNFKLKLMRRLKQILAQNRIKTSIFFRNFTNESKILKCKNECNAFKNYILRQEILKKNNFRFKNAIYDKKRDVYYKTMKRLKFISLFGSIRSYNNGATCKQVARKRKLKSLLQNIIIREMKSCKNCMKKKNRNEDNWNISTNNKTNYNKKLVKEEKIKDIDHWMLRHRIYKRKYRLRLLKKSVKKFYSIKWYKKWRKHRARNRNVKKLPHNIMEKINKYYLLFRTTLKLTDTSTQLLKDCLNVEAIIQENLIKDSCSKPVDDKENTSLINFILKRKNPMQEFNYIKDATGIQIEKFEKYLAHLATNNKRDILKYCQRLWRVLSIRPFPSICIKLWQCLGKHRRHRIDQNYFNDSSFISFKIIDDMRKNMKIHKSSPYSFSKEVLKNFIDIFNDYLGNDENKIEKQLSNTKMWNGFNGPIQNLRDKRNKTNSENHQSISKSIYHSLCTQSEVIELVVKMRHHIIRSQQLIKKKITDYFMSCFLTTFVNYLQHIPRYFGSKANICTASKAYDKWNMIEAFKLYSLTQIISYPFAIILDPINFIFVKLAVEWRFALNDWLVMHIRSRIKNILYYIINKIQTLNIWIKHFNQIYHLKIVIQEILNDYIHLSNEISSLEKLYLLTVHHRIPLSWKHFTAGFSIRLHFIFLMKLKLHRQTNLELSWPYILYDFLSEFEDLMLEIKEFSKDYEDNGPSDPDLPPNTAIKKIIFYKSWYAHLIPRYNELMLMTPFFGFISTELPELEKYNQKFNYLEKLFGIYITVMSLLKTYNQTSWCNFDIYNAQNSIQEYQNRIRILPAPLKKFYMFRELKKSLDSFNEYCFVLELLSNPALEKKHWNRLEDILNAKLPYDSLDFKLMHLLETKLLEYRDDVEDVYTCAIKEGEIRKKLNQYVSTWSKTKLFFAAYKEHGEVIFKGLETAELLGNLEEDIMVLKSMSTSRYSTFFANELSFWVSNLSLSHSLLKEWLKTQNLWVYLEPVFLTGDVPQQMPKPAIVFSKSTKNWMLIMQQAHNYYITDLGKNKWLKSILEQILVSLEQCLEALASYLESKRRRFPRFYFISDATLLEILELGSDIAAIQNYLAGLFENIDSLRFHEEMFGLIICIVSREGEMIPLLSYIPSIGSLEIWLNKLLVVSKLSLAKCISLAIGFAKSPHFDYITMVERYPSQVGLIGLQYLWTRDSEASMRQLFKYSESMIDTNKLFLNILNIFIDMTTRDLSRYKRVRYETLITIQIHQRDIYNDMVISGVNNPWDFQWQMQERFYYVRKKENILVQITDVYFVYQNEFMGCTDRLVITPLTDRCYITLAQAIGLSLGGAPAGPAGTGKTETTKDMGKSLGKYVVVFNCSDQMDFRGLGRIFKGLAQSGSWGCFDEFNRIELPVLSVAAQQIAIVLYARKNRKSSFIFSDGDIVTLSRELGIFLTMNPGYAGRQELPENLKINFRSVSMMVPDKHIIIRVKLASCGLKENIPLSRKFYVLYQLCVEQLSQQVHYDFGLRNILSVLRALGTQKRENVNESEESTLLRVLRDMNVSKLVDEDEPLFMTLIQDLFVGREVNIVIFSEIKKYIIKSCVPFLVIPHPSWVQKVLQLYDTSLVRHGIMIMGPTGSGKTQAIHVLLDAFTEKGISHSELRMNPKAITAPQMFGRLDVATNDWTDGIFSCLWRKTLKLPESEHLWIVLDGPVDAVWIENLNSVLDDNKTLTLANGDRIVMATNAKLVFEPDNVDNASPATVSRMGMVFISSSVLPWHTILNGWFLTRENTEVQILRVYFNQIFYDAYDYLAKNLSPKMKTLEVMYIRQAINILQGQIEYMKKFEDVKDFSPIYLQRLFLFSLMWSLGALLEIDERLKLEGIFVDHSSKLDWPNLVENDCGTIYDFVVNKKGDWEHWLTRVIEIHYPEDHVPDFANILVPNVDNVRTSFLLDIVTKLYKSVLLIGEQGTAKTVMIKSYLNSCDSDLYYNKSLNFSFATTPNIFQNYLEGYIEKRGGWKFGPPPGKRMILFIDDINMPVINEWGDQVTNEIVRQLMECGGVYSLDKPGEFIIVEDLQVVAAMIHPGGGRNDIPPRLKRQFSIFNCTLPSEQSMDKIFRFHCTGYFSRLRFNEDIVDFFPKLIPMTFEIWQRTKQKLLPTPANFHYIFNLRDLSRIWEGMMSIKGEECQYLETALKLWQHECLRVISDRLTSQKERDWFQNEIANVANEFLTSEEIKYYSQEESYFVDFLRDIPEATGDEPEDVALEAPKVYEEIESWDQIKNKLDFFQDQYNESVRGAKLNLVFFQDAIVHIVKISRIIRTPKGAALLVGVGGSGKQSLTKTATFIANYQLHQIAMSRSYNVSNFLDDIKYVYRIAGQDCRGVSFLFTDNEMKNESFLEILSNVIAIGVITNLFTKQEIYEIIGDLPMKMRILSPKAPINTETLLDFFFTQVKRNIHMVFCSSPANESFRSRALKFPGLISACTIDWFFRWPIEALVAVATHSLSLFEMECEPKIKVAIIETMGDVHELISDYCMEYYNRFKRRVFVTPKSYLTFLEGYKSIYNTKYNVIEHLAKQMRIGLKKLDEAQRSTDILKKKIKETEKEIEAANEIATKIADKVSLIKKNLEEIESKIKLQSALLARFIRKIVLERRKAKSQAKKAEPALLQAIKALSKIDASDIATVRKLGKPPYLITVILDVVLILLRKRLAETKYEDEQEFIIATWSESLKVLSDSQFLNQLRNYKRNLITDEMIDLMKPYVTYKYYTFYNAKVVCGNIAGLLLWSLAMVDFFKAYSTILPLTKQIELKEAIMKNALAELLVQHKYLAEQQHKLELIKNEARIAYSAKLEVQQKADSIKSKVAAAGTLMQGLGDEQVRWTNQLQSFNLDKLRLVGDALLMAGFLTYAGTFNQEYRQMLQSKWCEKMTNAEIPYTENLNVVENLTTVANINKWNNLGLPTDEHSVQNAIIVTNAKRFPLLIDPQNQGYKWIKNMEKNNQLMITTLTHKYFRQYVEDCLSLGRPLIIEDVLEEIDPILDNLLEKNYVKIGLFQKVTLGDREVDVNSDFRLYMTTKLRNPSYTPEVYARSAVIDFTVTIKGLEEQLLGLVINHERHELETERKELFSMVNEMKTNLKEFEGLLLYKLSTAKGALVDDFSLLTVLNTTLVMAENVEKNLENAYEAQKKINRYCELFRQTAVRGSVLYFLTVQISLIHCMYQTSLVQFIERFYYSMESAQRSEYPIERSNFINEFLTYDIFAFISKGLYEEHKFLWLLLLSLKVSIERKFINHAEFFMFIKGGASLDINDVEPKKFEWINDIVWLNICELSKHQAFKNLLKSIKTIPLKWKEWLESDTPEEFPAPSFSFSSNIFERLLLIRAMCPERTISMSKKFIANSLGDKFIEPVLVSVESIIEFSSNNVPIICLLSLGTDPTEDIEKLAERNKVKLSFISMGQGQEIQARKLVKQAIEKGNWMLLQNCHLGLAYMIELVSTLNEERLHNDFRIWLSTEPSEVFPVALLHMSLKFTLEPPQGIRTGLLRLYALMTTETLEFTNEEFYRPILFNISYLHTVCQERKKFGPIGWNIPYEFNVSDWSSSVLYLQKYASKEKSVNWVQLRYIIGDIMYGGRVTDEYDDRLLKTLCKYLFSDDILTGLFCFHEGYCTMNYLKKNYYIDALKQWPTSDPPEACGLGPTANITFLSNMSKKTLDTILLVEPKESSSSGSENREAIVLSIVSDMRSKLPNYYDPFFVKERLVIMGKLNSMNIFLRQEIDRMQRIIILVTETLVNLMLAIEGIIVLGESLRDAFDCIFDAKIPKIWKQDSWSSSTLGFWFSGLLDRNKQLSDWIFDRRPFVFWFGGFFNPQGFLTAMRQEVTRAHYGWSLETTALCNSVTNFFKEEIKSSPEEGVFVYGLFLEGAKWLKDIGLIEASPKEVYNPIPVINIFATLSSADTQQAYSCPVYRRKERTGLNYITTLKLHCTKDVDYWIFRGVALLCDTT